MELLQKIICLAFVSAIACVVVRRTEPAVGSALMVLACTGILIISMKTLSPFLEIIRKLQNMSGLVDAATAPVFKSVTIGIATQIAASVCRDCGESSIGKTVEIGGSFLSLYVTAPLLLSVLELFEQSLGG